MDPIMLFSNIPLYLVYNSEAIHNKDYSVVKTFKVVDLCLSPFSFKRFMNTKKNKKVKK